MFNVLQNCCKKFSQTALLNSNSSCPLPNQNYIPPKLLKPSTPKQTFGIGQFISDDNLPDPESFNYMSLEEAEYQRIAYKCFEAYAGLNLIKAKYYKANCISRGHVDCTKAGIDAKEKDKIVAELFKEVADDEANEFPKAQLIYGDFLYNGEGVERNLSEALKYFERAADNGLRVAMYNAGNLYYEGTAGKRDIKKAIHYMRLAVYNEYPPAIKFCENNNIPL